MTRRLALLCLLASLVATGCPGSPGGPDASTSPDASRLAPDTGPKSCPGCDAGADAGGYLGDGGRTELKIKSVLPGRGPLAGGTLVSLEGSGFYMGFATGASAAKSLTHIHFGANEAVDFDIIDDSSMEVVAPPNPAGTADVVVATPNGRATCAGCFGYFLELSLESVAPDHGPVEGGTEIELVGEAFAPSLTVLVGGRACTKVTVLDDRTARALVPPGDGGPADVRAFNKNGIGEIRRGFTYLAPPTLDRVDPPYGPLLGGNQVQLSGALLSGVTQVRFGAQEAAFTLVDDSRLEAVVPPGPGAGPVDVSVEAAQGQAQLYSGYVYYDPAATGLSIVSVTPTHGPAAGDNAVTVVGAGFDATTDFDFGGAKATVLERPDSHAARVLLPAGAPNLWVDVRAAASADQALLSHGYHYNLALFSVTPASGPVAGGQAVALRGQGFTAGLEAFFGPALATGLAFTSATELAAITPVGSGAVDVRVREVADVQNQASLAGGYSFREPVSLARVSPETGSVAGGTYVTVLGTGFAAGARVLFGKGPLKDLKVVDEFTIVGHTPPGEVGAVDVSVKQGAAQDVSKSAFSYFDPTNGGGGSSGGPLDGTVNVTVLDGSGMRYGQGLPDATVMLGLDPSTPFQGRTDHRGQITFSDPSLAKAQTITVSKEGYLTITVAQQQSQNVTVYLSSTEGYLGPPDQPKPDPASNGPALISGHVNGFKLPRPLGDHESAWAEVWLAPSSPDSTPPFGSQPSPAARDQRGEHWKVTEDGGGFTVFTSSGLRAVYAVYGIYDWQTGTLTPYLMGVHRAVNADSQHPQTNVDVLLDMHLDVEVPVHVDGPAYDPLRHAMASTQVYGWLELGAEGVIPLSSVSTTSPDCTLSNMPHVDGEDLFFLVRASLGDSGPTSYAYRKQLGEVAKGLTVGPLLGLPWFTTPALGDTFSGQLAWTLDADPPADVARLRVTKVSPATGWSQVWYVILPGDQRALTMPQNLSDDLLATSAPGDIVIVSLSTGREARFDYAYWTYGSLSSWTSWVELQQTFALLPSKPP